MTALNRQQMIAFTKLQRELAILKSSIKEAGNIEALNEISVWLDDEAEQAAEEYECYGEPDEDDEFDSLLDEDEEPAEVDALDELAIA